MIRGSSTSRGTVDTALAGSRAVIGIDVGGTAISGGLVGKGGEILAVVTVPTHAQGKGRAVETLVDVARDLVAEARRLAARIDGIGIGLPGLVDAEKGMMASPGNLVGEFAHVPLADRLRAVSGGAPVFVDNDVNALTLGEWIFGAARGVASLGLLAVGTALGGGLILDGRLVRGRSGCAGEFGHAPVELDGPPCLCGGRGCVAVYVGGLALVRAAGERLARGAPSALLALAGGDAEKVSTAMIFEAAAAGDGLARQLVGRACRAMGACIATVVNTVDPGLVIVTGGVARSLLPLEAEIMAYAGVYALGHALRGTRVVLVPSDKRRTVLGGAALAVYELARRAVQEHAPAAATPARPAGGA